MKLKKNGYPANASVKTTVFGVEVPAIQHFERDTRPEAVKLVLKERYGDVVVTENEPSFLPGKTLSLRAPTLIKLLRELAGRLAITKISEFSGMSDGMERCSHSIAGAALTQELQRKQNGLRITFDGRKVRVRTYVASYDIVDFNEELRRAVIVSQLPILDGNEDLATTATRARHRYLDGLPEAEFIDAINKLKNVRSGMGVLEICDPWVFKHGLSSRVSRP